ncbi:hypothetical protein DRA43_02500 [Micromonospora provocatoris]|nr:hypothetical protein [Micromonospora provocatoris]RBJ10501.1 hypothetical protein DRA43_02500 [Micromonospora provocatoris]
MVEPTTKLRPRDVSDLPRETTRDQITTILTSSYENFCTCVDAEATRPWVPRALQQVLRKASWRDDWIDALTRAEATLQIAVMRARYEEGPTAARTRSNTEALAKVRTRLHQVRASNRKKPRAPGDVDEEVRAATKALIRVYPTEFNDLVVAAFKTAGVDLNARKVPAGGTDVVVSWALQLDPPVPGVPAVTSRAREIAAMPDSTFDNLVAADIQREPEEAELCHPLLLDRWGESLERLAQATADLLGLPHRPMAAIADADLTVAGLDEETAFRRINSFVFGRTYSNAGWSKRPSDGDSGRR